MSQKNEVRLVACFSRDMSAGLRGGIEEINIRFTFQEPDEHDVAELCQFFREYLDADAVVTEAAYVADTERQNAMFEKAAGEDYHEKNPN